MGLDGHRAGQRLVRLHGYSVQIPIHPALYCYKLNVITIIQ